MSLPSRRYDGFLPGRPLIDGYGRGGFRFGEMSHIGSILALPDGIHAWTCQDALLDEAALQKILAQASEIDILLVGAGASPAFLPEPVRWRLQDASIRVDVMATGPAAQTFNILRGERRQVAAALIAVE